jgi:hypothetical protein
MGTGLGHRNRVGAGLRRHGIFKEEKGFEFYKNIHKFAYGPRAA